MKEEEFTQHERERLKVVWENWGAIRRQLHLEIVSAVKDESKLVAVQAMKLACEEEDKALYQWRDFERSQSM